MCCCLYTSIERDFFVEFIVPSCSTGFWDEKTKDLKMTVICDL